MGSMTFLHKLAHRLARLKADARTVVSATAVVAGAVIACEKMANPSSPGSAVSQLAVSPKVVTLQPNQLQDFMAVGFTPTGDTAQADVTWSASAGSVGAKDTRGGRHYGWFKNGTCGTYTVTATAHPGNASDAANVTVACTGP